MKRLRPRAKGCDESIQVCHVKPTSECRAQGLWHHLIKGGASVWSRRDQHQSPNKLRQANSKVDQSVDSVLCPKSQSFAPTTTTTNTSFSFSAPFHDNFLRWVRQSGSSLPASLASRRCVSIEVHVGCRRNIAPLIVLFLPSPNPMELFQVS